MVCMLPWHVVDHVSIVVWVYPENLTLFFLILITYFSEGVWLSWDNMSSTWFVMRRMSKKWWSTISRKWTTTSYLNSVNIWKDHDKETNNHLLPQLSEHMKRPWQGNVNYLLPQLSEHMKRPWQGNEQPPLTSTQWTYEKTMTRKCKPPLTSTQWTYEKTMTRKWTTTSYLNSVNIWKDHDIWHRKSRSLCIFIFETSTFFFINILSNLY